MNSSIVKAFADPITGFAGCAGPGFVAAVGAVSVSVCVSVCCLPRADVAPLQRWVDRTSAAAPDAATTSLQGGSAATQHEADRAVRDLLDRGHSLLAPVRLPSAVSVPRVAVPGQLSRAAQVADTVTETVHNSAAAKLTSQALP